MSVERLTDEELSRVARSFTEQSIEAAALRARVADKEDLIEGWRQKHRMFCLELALKLGAGSAEEAIGMAEKLGVYILSGSEPPVKA